MNTGHVLEENGQKRGAPVFPALALRMSQVQGVLPRGGGGDLGLGASVGGGTRGPH